MDLKAVTGKRVIRSECGDMKSVKLNFLDPLRDGMAVNAERQPVFDRFKCTDIFLTVCRTYNVDVLGSSFALLLDEPLG